MVTETNKTYDTFSPLWKKCRDIISGATAVKNGGEDYLPRPSGMDKEEYKKNYLERAEFYPATARTHEGLDGLAKAKPIIKTIPNGLDEWLENVNGEGKNIDDFIFTIFSDCLKTNWGGVLVDAPNSNGLSITESEKMGLYPYMAYYPAESIINVQTSTQNRNKVVSLIVLKEIVNQPSPTDIYTTIPINLYRVLRLDEGIYKQELYNEHNELLEEIYPTKAGKYLDYIPFYFLTDVEPSNPMLENLADVNLAWYRKSADLENGAHWTGVPTPYAIGHIKQPDEEVIKLGGAHFIYFTPDVTSVGFLEFSGNGLNVLRQLLIDDQERMAMLGARIIAQDKKVAETATTTEIHRIGENSVLATFCNKLSSSLSKATKDYLEWSIGKDITDDVILQINTDYNLNDIDNATLTALVSTWQTGGISKRTLFDNLKKGEIISADKTYEEEQAEIQEEGIVLPHEI